MNKQNKGITLIALVITIVVLVILVGVSVSVAINTGLVENSKIAVSDYDNAQKAEGQAIEEIAWEINSQANKNALKIYDGVVVVEPKQTLANIKSKLPSGYTIGDDNGTEITDESTIILTGMKILNSNGIVGRVVLLGDVDEDTQIMSLDTELIQQAVAGSGEGAELAKKDYIKVVMDVNRDGKINDSDAYLVAEFEIYSITEFPNKGYTGAASSIRIEKILRTTMFDWDSEDNYTVARLEETKLTNGETIGDINGNAIEESAKSTTYASTGMTIIRNNEVVGRIAVIGDVQLSKDLLGNPSVDVDDCLLVIEVKNGKRTVEEDYIKSAMDVNNDGRINQTDADIILCWIDGSGEWDFEANEGEWPDQGFDGGASLIQIGE